MVRKTLLVSLIAVFLSSPSAAAESDCALQIESAQNASGGYKLVLKHAPGCEITVQREGDRVILSSKVSDTQGPSERESNTSAGGSTGEDAVSRILALARSKLGDRYQPAQAGSDHFDCSGVVYYVFRRNGFAIPRTSLQQSQIGPKLKREELRPGDIVSFDTYKRNHINHSGIYLGEGKFIHSSSGHAYGVTISDLDHGFYKEKFRWGVRPPWTEGKNAKGTP